MTSGEKNTVSETNFTPAQARDLLMTLVGATDDSTVKDVLKAAIVAKAASDGLKAGQLSAEEVVRDLFIQRELHKVPPAFEVKMGPAAAASGEGAVGMVDHYSRFAPQPQALTAEYERFNTEMGQMRAYMKSLTEQIEAVGKAVATLVAAKADEEDEEDGEEEAPVVINQEEEGEEEEEEKSLGKYMKSLRNEIKADILAKAEEEEEEEEGDSEEEEEEEAGKSLSASTKVNLAKATYFAAKDALGETVAKAKRSFLKKAAEKALQKAFKMAKAAEADTADKDAVKEARKAIAMIEEYAFVRSIPLTVKKAAKKAESKPEDEHNQKKWPDEESVKSFNDMVSKLETMQTDVRGFMDRIGQMSKGKTVVETVEPLAKAMESPNFFVEKARYIDSEAKAHRIDDATYGAAMEVLSAMEMAKTGRISQDVPNALLNGASGRVKELFNAGRGA